MRSKKLREEKKKEKKKKKEYCKVRRKNKSTQSRRGRVKSCNIFRYIWVSPFHSSGLLSFFYIHTSTHTHKHKKIFKFFFFFFWQNSIYRIFYTISWLPFTLISFYHEHLSNNALLLSFISCSLNQNCLWGLWLLHHQTMHNKHSGSSPSIKSKSNSELLLFLYLNKCLLYIKWGWHWFLLLKVRIKLMDREQLKTDRQQASISIGYAKNGRGRVQVWKQAMAVIY